MSIFTTEFWRSIGWALVRTVLAGIVPFVPGLVATPAATLPAAAATVGLLLVVAIVTSLRGIATPDTAPWWQVLVSRGLRQFAQFIAAGVGSAVLLSDIAWTPLLLSAAGSAVSTVLLAALTLIPGEPAAAAPELVAEEDEADGFDPAVVSEPAEPQRAIED